jgi:hypothetical protein
MAKGTFEELLPTLRAAESVQERKNLTVHLKALMTLAVLSQLIPGFRIEGAYEVVPDGVHEETETWNPHVQRWLTTLQLLGPYVWD